MKAFELILFLFFVLFIDYSFAENKNIDNYIDNIKKIKEIDKEKVDEGIKILEIIKKVYLTLSLFFKNINDIIFSIIKTIFGDNDKSSKVFVFTYRQL